MSILAGSNGSAKPFGVFVCVCRCAGEPSPPLPEFAALRGWVREGLGRVMVDGEEEGKMEKEVIEGRDGRSFGVENG